MEPAKGVESVHAARKQQGRKGTGPTDQKGKKRRAKQCRTYQECQYNNRKNDDEREDSEGRGCPSDPRSRLVVPQVLGVGFPKQARESRPGEGGDTLKDRYRRHDWRGGGDVKSQACSTTGCTGTPMQEHHVGRRVRPKNPCRAVRTRRSEAKGAACVIRERGERTLDKELPLIWIDSGPAVAGID